MSAAEIIPMVAFFLLLTWGTLAIRFAPAVYRGFRHKERENDKLRAFLFWVAVLQIAFAARRFVAPADDSSLLGLYILSVMCAIVGCAVLRGYDRAS